MLNIPTGKNLDSPLSFKSGTVLFAEGEVPKYLFIIKKGNVQLLKSNGQHLLLLKNCSDREILNELSILNNSPLGFTAIAKTDVELILVEQKDIQLVLKKGPSWIPEIFQTLCSRLESTLEIIEEHNLMVGEKNSDLFLNKEEETKLHNALFEYKSH